MKSLGRARMLVQSCGSTEARVMKSTLSTKANGWDGLPGFHLESGRLLGIIVVHWRLPIYIVTRIFIGVMERKWCFWSCWSSTCTLYTSVTMWRTVMGVIIRLDSFWSVQSKVLKLMILGILKVIWLRGLGETQMEDDWMLILYKICSKRFFRTWKDGI